MKMQEVITAMRIEVPVLAKCKEDVGMYQRKAWGLFDDLRRCESTEARMLLTDAFGEAMDGFARSFVDMCGSVERMQQLNAGYTRRLGPKKPTPEEDPRQMKLGLEGGDDSNDSRG